MNAEDALKKLKQGNLRFVETCQDDGQLITLVDLNNMASAQNPFAVVLGCSDSRVPAELIFHQSLSDLFVIRVAGNIVAPSQIGSVEYACQHLGVQLVVVLGHTQCGAIGATVDSLLGDTDPLSPNIAAIVDRMTPAVQPLIKEYDQVDKNKLLHQAGRANVQQSVQSLYKSSAIIENLVDAGNLKIVGAECSLETGVVKFYDNN